MKNPKKTLFFLSVLCIGAMLSGCASASSTYGPAKTLEEAHPDRIEKTVIGMSVNDFKTVWPEATKSGMSEDGEIYEFVYAHSPMGGYMHTYDYKIYTQFYFTNDKLVKYESSQKSGL
jgi:hypothetical protein